MQWSGGYTTRIRRLYNKDQEVLQQGSGGYTTRVRRLLAGSFGIGASIRIGRELLCLPYAGFFLSKKNMYLKLILLQEPKNILPMEFLPTHKKVSILIWEASVTTTLKIISTNGHQDITCPLCKLEPDSQEYALSCHIIADHLNPSEKNIIQCIAYEDIFGYA